MPVFHIRAFLTYFSHQMYGINFLVTENNSHVIERERLLLISPRFVCSSLSALSSQNTRSE